MTERELTCIVCPMGCRIRVTQDDSGAVTEVSGNSCPRGAAYAKNEVTHPTRTLTTTVRIKNRPGRVLPVKTACPIAKENLLPAMKILKGTEAEAPIRIGDVVLPALFGEADVVATENIP